jgi:hypothetical protein
MLRPGLPSPHEISDLIASALAAAAGRVLKRDNSAGIRIAMPTRMPERRISGEKYPG